MKIIISILLLSAVVVCSSCAESMNDALKRGRGPLPSGTVRTNAFPDLFGNPVKTYTDTNGNSSVVTQRPFPDLFGNPVYDVKQQD